MIPDPYDLFVIIPMAIRVRDRRIIHMEMRRTKTRPLPERKEKEENIVPMLGQARAFHERFSVAVPSIPEVDIDSLSEVP